MKKLWYSGCAAVLCACLLLPNAAAATDFNTPVQGQVVYENAVYGDVIGGGSGTPMGESSSGSNFNGAYAAVRFIGSISQYSRKNVMIDLDSKWNGMQWGGALAAGYNFKPRFDVPLRAELEISIFDNADTDEETVTINGRQYKATNIHGMQVFTLFVNGYWDINTGSAFTPYVTAGLGMARLSSDGALYGEIANGGWQFGDSTVNNFAWNVGLGLSYAFTGQFSVDAGYRYASLGSASNPAEANAMGANSIDGSDLGMHQFSLGLRYMF